MSTNQRNYRATFILDNRGTEDTIEKIIEDVKTEITAVNGAISKVENIGRKDFVRVTDKKLTAANYVHVDFSAAAEVPAILKERLRLKQYVYRTFIESV
jgi:small subunit ribosomal protein S6